MKTVLVIGAGRFGFHLAKSICEMGSEVMLVDKDERVIDEYEHLVTTAEIGDYTIKSNLEALGVDDYDYVFVCVGDFQDSLVIVDHLKELGATHIVAKAVSEVHERFLHLAGADTIVYPERDFAYTTAVEFSNRKIFDFIKLSDDEGIYEIEVPSGWCNKSLLKLNVRQAHNVLVIASKSPTGKVTAIKDPEYIFNSDEHIIVMGNKDDINKLTK